MGGNKITCLGDPMEATDAINRSFLNKNNWHRFKKCKSWNKIEITALLSELTKTNNENVS